MFFSVQWTVFLLHYKNVGPTFVLFYVVVSQSTEHSSRPHCSRTATTRADTTALRWKCNYKMAAAVLPHPCVSLILSCLNQHQLLLIYSLGATTTTPPLERNIYEPDIKLKPGNNTCYCIVCLVKISITNIFYVEVS